MHDDTKKPSTSSTFDKMVGAARASVPRIFADYFKGFSRATWTVLTLITQILVIAYIGAIVGSYFKGKEVQEDCRRVNTAKVGDGYISCTPLVPKKDDPTLPPR